MSLLLILNIPPPYQGTTIMNQYLVDTLTEKNIDFIHLRINSGADLKALGKLSCSKLMSAFNIVKKIFSLKREYQVAYLVMSVEGFAFYRHLFFILLLLVLKKTCILHLRGLGFRHKKGTARLLTSFIFRKSYLVQHSALNSFDIENYTYKKLFYIPNGWPDYYYRHKEQVQGRFHSTSKELNIIFLSNLMAGKGLFTVTDAILQICSAGDCKDLKIKWNFIGNWESESIRLQFYDFIESNRLQSSLGHVGPLYNDEKYSLLANMDILLFPTFYKHETWGNVILEAMMFKIPVIATRYVAIPEMVKHNKTGFLIETENTEELVDKLKLLISNPALRKRMGCEGRKWYLENFTSDIFKTNMLHLFKTVSL
ncbi:MAG: glycosyltransferase family 4 protein [Chitinophagaceae bacterium]